MEHRPPDLIAPIARLRELGLLHADDVDIKPLTGLTNRSYRVSTPDGSIVVRLPGLGAGNTIDRHAEAINARLVANLGIGPEIVFLEPSSGLMATRYVDCSAFGPPAGASDRRALERAARPMRRLHESGLAFRGSTSLRVELQQHAQLVRSARTDLPESLDRVVRNALEAAETLAQARPRLVPCHNDPTPDNARGRTPVVWLDWEYAAMNDPAWDIAYFEIMADLPPDKREVWRRAHYGRALTHDEAARLRWYHVALDVLAALWSMVQSAAAGGSRALPVEAQRRLARLELDTSLS